MDRDNIKNIITAFNSLLIYRNIRNDEIIGSFYSLIESLNGDRGFSDTMFFFGKFFHRLSKEKDFPSLKLYLFKKILYDDNVFSQWAEFESPDKINGKIMASVLNDLRLFRFLLSFSFSNLKDSILNLAANDMEIHMAKELPDFDIESELSFPVETRDLYRDFLSTMPLKDFAYKLAEFYNGHGYGDFALYRAFVWEKSGKQGLLKGVENPDPISLSELIGYEIQRGEVLDNTIKFLRGLPANNMLLYGDRGTGKSSTIKAIANKYHNQGLRIIEVPKKHLADFPIVLRYLRNRNLKFIIFIDDLTFEDNEENYTELKAILEGGIESKPQNALIYATSNRRHLVKEKFSDRRGLSSADPDEEIHAGDTIQEKLSLADRFGIKVTFSTPGRREYLKIVEGIIHHRGIKVDKEYLHREALKWELHYNGRSPRTARQFADWLEGSLSPEG